MKGKKGDRYGKHSIYLAFNIKIQHEIGIEEPGKYKKS